jgi:hypothetical protein
LIAEIINQINERCTAIGKRLAIKMALSHENIHRLEKYYAELLQAKNTVLDMIKISDVAIYKEKYLAFEATYQKLVADVTLLLETIKLSAYVYADTYREIPINRIVYRGSAIPPRVIFEKGFSLETNNKSIPHSILAQLDREQRITNVLQSRNVMSFSKNIDSAAMFPIEEKSSQKYISYIYLTYLRSGFDVHAHGYFFMSKAQRKHPQRFLFGEEICCEMVQPTDVIAAIQVSRDFSQFPSDVEINRYFATGEYPSYGGGKYRILDIQYNESAVNAIQRVDEKTVLRLQKLINGLIGTERAIAGDHDGYNVQEEKQMPTAIIRPT